MSKRKAYRPIKPKVKKTRKTLDPLWDLDRDGLTYSLLSKFVVCPERFRLSAVEGWEESGLKTALEFGNAFHYALEKSPQPYEKSLNEFQRSKLEGASIRPNEREDLEVLMAMVAGLLHGYQRVWEKDHSSMRFLYQEQTFEFFYPLTMDDGRVQNIRLRGKWDGVFREVRDNNRLWLLETKTKDDIDSDGLARTLPQDLQTMLYCLSIEKALKEPVSGVLYNVVKRPGIRPKKGGKTGMCESIRDYELRLKEDVLTRPDFYYHRFVVQLSPGDLDRWCVQTFDPLLRHVVRWWDSIKTNPFDPWASPYHYRRPFGIYDGLAAGRRGDFFDLLTTGSYSGLRQKSSVFPELEGDCVSG